MKVYGRTTKKNPKYAFKRLLPLIVSFVSLAVLLTVLLAVRLNESVAEWCTTHISKYIVFVMGHITSVLPFSLYEWTLILVIAGVIALVVLAIVGLCKKKYFAVLKGICIFSVVAIAFGNLYTLSAGFAYYRKPLEIERSETVYKGDILLDIANGFADDMNALSAQLPRDENGNVISPYSVGELAEKLREEYKRLDGDYFFSYTPKAKKLVNGWFMTSSGFTGVSFLPFGEPNVNGMTPASDLPQTMAHELAHTKGVMRENEANLTAYWLLLSSDDPYLRYCGYFATLGTMYSAVAIGNNYDFEKADEFWQNVAPEFKKEQSNATEFWLNYRGPFAFLTDFLDRAGRWFNDLYLKINGADDGEGSYNNPWDIIETPVIDPDTGETIITYEPVYSEIHKIYFAIYESRNLR